jgi:hypothetical protein
MFLSNLCTPAFIYIVLAIIGMVMALKNTSLISGLVSLLFIVIWTMFLNFLCKKGYKGISWFLLFLPFLSVLLVISMGMKSKLNY